MIKDSDALGLAESVRAMHVRMRDTVVDAMATAPAADLRASDGSAAGDTAYGIDKVSEAVLLELLGAHLEDWLPVVVIAEGLPDIGIGTGIAVVLEPPRRIHGFVAGRRAHAKVDRHRRRSADRDSASQADNRGHVVGRPGRRRFRGPNRSPRRGLPALPVAPSAATSLDHGFGQVARVFPGCRDVLAAIDDEVCLAVVGPGGPRRGVTFEDQYISTGGQLAELVFGHDRWTADLRPLLSPLLAARGLPPPQCCHPYDICTALIAEEAGLLVSGVDGPLDHTLELDSDVAWVGYANESIRALVEPALRKAIARHLAAG